MAKGRNTTLLTTRIPDRLFEAIEVVAERRGMTMSEYVRSILEVRDELLIEMEARRQMDHPEETAR